MVYCWSFIFDFHRINYIDFPYGSGIPEPESAYCAMLDTNISPKVGNCYHIIQCTKIFIEVVPYPRAVIPDILSHPNHLPVLLLREDDPDDKESQQQQHQEVSL